LVSIKCACLLSLPSSPPSLSYWSSFLSLKNLCMFKFSLQIHKKTLKTLCSGLILIHSGNEVLVFRFRSSTPRSFSLRFSNVLSLLCSQLLLFNFSYDYFSPVFDFSLIIFVWQVFKQWGVVCFSSKANCVFLLRLLLLLGLACYKWRKHKYHTKINIFYWFEWFPSLIFFLLFSQEQINIFKRPLYFHISNGI
jgi:hypothetical protein